MSVTTGARYLAIFDCDGVLVDSEPISNRILAAAIGRAGIPMTPEEVTRTFEGMRLRDIQAVVERRLDKELPGTWLSDFEAKRATAFEKELTAILGIAAVLSRAVDSGVPMCVASQARREKMELTLGLTGLREFFPASALFSSTMVERGKPHPDLFLLAAESMGFEPNRCIVIEDGLPGVRAGRSAGMAVLGYAPDGDGDRLALGGARVFTSMEELPELIGLSG